MSMLTLDNFESNKFKLTISLKGYLDHAAVVCWSTAARRPAAACNGRCSLSGRGFAQLLMASDYGGDLEYFATTYVSDIQMCRLAYYRATSAASRNRHV